MRPSFASAIASQTWHAEAACAQEWPDSFFPGPGRADHVAAALETCARCPVLDACRRYALTAREPHGIWGGLTEKQRESVHRRAQKAGVAPTEVLAVLVKPEPKVRAGRIVVPAEQLAKRYSDGESLEQIAAAIGRAQSTVRRRLISAGVQMRSRGHRYATVIASTEDPTC